MSRVNAQTSAKWWLALVALAALTAYGFYEVLGVRFSSGEGYPIYSTLRADPLGTRALFEALDRLPEVDSARNFERIEKLVGAPGDTLMLLNVSVDAFNKHSGSLDGRVLARWVAAGGRLVITIDSQSGDNRRKGVFDKAINEVEEERRVEDEERKTKREKKSEESTGDDKEKSRNKKEPKEERSEETRFLREATLAETLKISLNARELMPVGKSGFRLTPGKGMPLAPADLPVWFSGIFLNDDPKQDWKKLSAGIGDRLKKKTDDRDAGDKKAEHDKEKTPMEEAAALPSPWHMLATRGTRAVIVERKLGKGSVVICTDSFFASNEALWSNPKAKFLAWLAGDARRVIFDETHLGSSIGDEDSLMTLARRYRMHGLFIGSLLFFGLYVWRNSTSLVPRDPSHDLGHWRNDAVAGQGAAAGLEGLLRRGVSRQQLLRRCFDTWDSTAAAANTTSPDRRAKARATMAEMADTKQAAPAYRKLRDIIHLPRQ